MRPLRIGWDLDGVGYVFGESVRQSMLLDGYDIPPTTDEFCKSWDFFEYWGMSRSEFEIECSRAVDRGICFGPGPGLTRPNFFESMARTHDMGHTNVIITHRYQGSPGMAMGNTFRWLEHHGAQYDEIYFSGDKTIVETDMFVEDNKDNYDRLVEAGVDAYLINRPWNRPYEDHRKRILDVENFADAVNAKTLGVML